MPRMPALLEQTESARLPHTLLYAKTQSDYDGGANTSVNGGANNKYKNPE